MFSILKYVLIQNTPLVKSGSSELNAFLKLPSLNFLLGQL